jgi:hypothetical protein
MAQSDWLLAAGQHVIESEFYYLRLKMKDSKLFVVSLMK